MDIYIKANKKLSLYEDNIVKIKDIAEVFGGELTERVGNIKLLAIKSDKDEKFLITNLDIIKKVDQALPGNTINCIGELDTIVLFSPKKKKENKLWLWIKVAIVTATLIIGSSTAIMSFHTDAQVPTIFRNYYYMFFRETPENPLLIDIPYSIGLALGIIVFFNHINSKKKNKDPSPLEVEMSLYDDDISDTLIDELSNKKNEEKNN